MDKLTEHKKEYQGVMKNIVARLTPRVASELHVRHQSVEAMRDDIFYTYVLTKEIIDKRKEESEVV